MKTKFKVTIVLASLMWSSSLLMAQVSPVNVATEVYDLLTGNDRTITDPDPLSFSQTWNDAADTMVAMEFDITDTTSAAGSMFMNFKVGGSSVLSFRKDGAVSTDTIIEKTSANGVTIDGLNIKDGNLTDGTDYILQSSGTLAGTDLVLTLGDVEGSGNSTNITVDDGNQIIMVSGAFAVVPSATPASASATGTAGTVAWDANYIYVCVATNTWKRVAISTW